LGQKGSDLGQHIAASTMSRSQAWLCYYAYVYLGMMAYSLAVTHFIEKTADKYTVQANPSFVERNGVQPNYAKGSNIWPKGVRRRGCQAPPCATRQEQSKYLECCAIYGTQRAVWVSC
jgi:hypothetical protein